jgi:hypothetical protein
LKVHEGYRLGRDRSTSELFIDYLHENAAGKQVSFPFVQVCTINQAIQACSENAGGAFKRA